MDEACETDAAITSQMDARKTDRIFPAVTSTVYIPFFQTSSSKLILKTVDAPKRTIASIAAIKI